MQYDSDCLTLISKIVTPNFIETNNSNNVLDSQFY